MTELHRWDEIVETRAVIQLKAKMDRAASAIMYALLELSPRCSNTGTQGGVLTQFGLDVINALLCVGKEPAELLDDEKNAVAHELLRKLDRLKEV